MNAIPLLHQFFLIVWDTEWTLEGWRNGLIVKILTKKETSQTLGTGEASHSCPSQGKVSARWPSQELVREWTKANKRASRVQNRPKHNNNCLQKETSLSNPQNETTHYTLATLKGHSTASTVPLCGYELLWDTNQTDNDFFRMYHQSECAGAKGAAKADRFEVRFGVKQGCSMSVFLFLLVIERMMKKTERGATNG